MYRFAMISFCPRSGLHNFQLLTFIFQLDQGMILDFFRYLSSSENTQPQYFWI